MYTVRTNNKGTIGRGRHLRGGFSIIELLIAIIIIGVLVAVLIPIVSRRTESARQARANSDVQNLAESMERAAIDSGYYVRLFALNSTLRGDGVGFNRQQAGDPIDRADGITDFASGVTNPHHQFPTNNSLFIDPTTGLFANVSRDNVIARLAANETTYDGTASWQGPYINWSRDNNQVNNLVARDGVPDDPWGNNYLFFTREGLVVEPDGVIADSAEQRTSGGMGAGGTFSTLLFDRPTILSLGPNGLPGDGSNVGFVGQFGGDDDVFRQFGR